jgi:hypothetical protein
MGKLLESLGIMAYPDSATGDGTSGKGLQGKEEKEADYRSGNKIGLSFTRYPVRLTGHMGRDRMDMQDF